MKFILMVIISSALALINVTSLAADEVRNPLTTSIESKNPPAILKVTSPRQNIPIYIDGYFVGYTPLEELILLTPGKHILTIYDPSRIDRKALTSESRRLLKASQYEITLKSGEVTEIFLDPEQITARAKRNALVSRGSFTIFLVLSLLMLTLFPTWLI